MYLKSIKAPRGYQCFPQNSKFNFFPEPLICIAGENGSGKTTTLKMIKCDMRSICKEFYLKVENVVLIDESNLVNNPIDYHRRDFSRIPEEVWNLTGIKYQFNRFQNLIFFKNQNKVSYFDLSSGERQLIAIFYMLNYYRDQSKNYPTIILLDEPDLHFNSVWRKKFSGLLRDFLNQNQNIQIIFTTHNLEVLSDMKEREVYLCANRKVENITFNPFGMNKETLEKKLFSNQLSISSEVEAKFKKYDSEIKNLAYDNPYTRCLESELDEIEDEIEMVFADSAIKNQLFDKIDKMRGR